MFVFFRSAKEKLNATLQPVAQPYCAPEPPLASPLLGTVPVPVTLATPATPSSSHQLTPHQLHYGTPSEQSPSSSNSSQLTPQMENMKLGQVGEGLEKFHSHQVMMTFLLGHPLKR